ncbi:MAG: serine/threonine protein kinase, partial [bacterium]|nr:serine/threonine protein kinase [Candidatus Kapabacteria bacterium]
MHDPQRTIAHYRILDKLGEGGMGVVYRAEDTRLGRTVALKFLPRSRTTNPESADRFLREARSAAQINHPNVCTVFDIIEADDERFIVMELVEGSTLRDIVGAQSSGPSRMPIDLALEYTHQIAAAL